VNTIQLTGGFVSALKESGGGAELAPALKELPKMVIPLQ